MRLISKLTGGSNKLTFLETYLKFRNSLLVKYRYGFMWVWWNQSSWVSLLFYSLNIFVNFFTLIGPIMFAFLLWMSAFWFIVRRVSQTSLRLLVHYLLLICLFSLITADATFQGVRATFGLFNDFILWNTRLLLKNICRSNKFVLDKPNRSTKLDLHRTEYYHIVFVTF